MQKFIFYLLIILGSLSLLAQQEPVVKIYHSDGSTKQYNIEDIADMSFIHSNLSYSMIICRKDTSKITYDIRLISSINFVDNQKLQIKYGFEPTILNISEIDSIIFSFNTCTEIQIGNQIWMCKNLDVDHYRNGDSIPEVRGVSGEMIWAYTKTGAWCYFDNDTNNGKIYGKLYNWKAVNDPRGLAPEGWHIATDAEWTELADYLGGYVIAGGKMKETGTEHWWPTNNGATNESGFSALPGGYRSGLGECLSIGREGNFWTSTERNAELGWSRNLSSSYAIIRPEYQDKVYGFSIRCVKNSNVYLKPVIFNIKPNSTNIGEEVILAGGGFGSIQDTSYVIFNNIKATIYPSWSNKEIKVKVPAGSTSGKVSVTVKDKMSNEVDYLIDNPCTEVTIGNQVWMCKNLDVDHYRNGDSIPEIRDSIQWPGQINGAWCYYNNDTALGKKYGKLYNWYAVNDPRGLAPEGWHIPSDSELTTLITYLGGRDEAGGKLKEIGTVHWYAPNTLATNESGFTARPGGLRVGGNGLFMGYGSYANFWSLEYNYNFGWFMFLKYDEATAYVSYNMKNNGYSVRCIKNK